MRLPRLLALLSATTLAVVALAADADLAAARRLACEGKSDDAIAAAKAAQAGAPGDAAPGRLIQDVLRDEHRRAELDAFVPEGVTPQVKSLLAARLLPAKQAEPALKTLATAEGAPPQAQLDLATASLALDRSRPAEGMARAYTEQHPDDPEGHVVLARARIANGDEKGAAAALEKAVTLAPGWAPAVSLYAATLRRAGKGDVARKALTTALATFPGSPGLLRGLAADQVSAAELTAAEETLSKLVSLREKDATARCLLADVQRQARRLEAAEATARKAVELDPADPATHRMLGLVLEKKDDFKGALAAYDEEVRLSPDAAQPLVDRAIAQSLLGDDAAARKTLEQAVKLDKKCMDAHFRLGQVLYLLNELDLAKKSVNVVLADRAEDVPANRLMGRILLADGKPSDAMRFLQKAADGDPADAESMRLIGKAWTALGKADKAFAAFTSAVERNPKDGWAHLELGKALERKGDFGAAETSYGKAIELMPSKAAFQLHMAELLDDRKNEPKRARPFYERYLALGGADADGSIRARIEQIGK